MRSRLILVAILTLTGCSAFPEALHEPQYHNPFPQLTRVAVLPFYNQSAEPTVDQDRIALAYYNELQQIPGFEVVPVGVARQLLLSWQRSATGLPSWGGSRFDADKGADAATGMPLQMLLEPMTGDDFQRLAQFMDVDAVVVGSVTEYTPYYPPRFGLAVRWYAANPGFHPIPPGYGLPWGTAREADIAESYLFDAEHALAREQLKTQTPCANAGTGIEWRPALPGDSLRAVPPSGLFGAETATDLPLDWPDPRGLVPPPPQPARPPCVPQHEPVLSHTRLYHGNDADFTRRLSDYYRLRDEARFGGWQGYLQRSDDFVRFCCHLHITEMLAERGGEGETRVVWRWPIGRYER